MQVDAQVVVAMIGGISGIVAAILGLVMKLLFNGSAGRLTRIELALDNHIIETRDNLKDVVAARTDLLEAIHRVSERLTSIEAMRPPRRGT